MSRFAELLQEDHQNACDPSLRTVLPGEQPRYLPGPSPLPPPGRGEWATDKTDWLRAWAVLEKRWRLSTLFAVSVVTAVLLVTLLTKPVYAPKSRVEIDPPGAELFSLEGRGGSEGGADYLETQARNMQSDELLVSVMRQLQLDQVPEFKNKGFITRSIGAALSMIESVPVWLWGGGTRDQPSVPDSALLVLNSGEASTLREMQRQLSVERDTASRLVTISFASHDPVLSATVTNAVVRSFIDRTYQTRHKAIMESTEWLARQLDDIRTRMEQSNRALADFQRASGIADIDQNRSTFTEQMAELSRQRIQAQAERIQIESYLGRARGNFETLPQIQSNQVVQLLTQKLGETRAELAQSLAVYGKNHPNAKRLQNQVEELEAQIQLQRNAIVGQMETSYTAALSREQMIDSQLRGTARELGQLAQYTALKKEAQANTDLYNGLYSRVKEAGIAAASKSINIRVVDQARVLDTPTRPQPLINLGIGASVALIIGVLVAFVREALDNKIHTIEDVRQSVGIRAVSMVPIAEGNDHSMLGSFVSVFGTNPKSRYLDGPANFLMDEPASEQSEAFRGIHTAVMLSQPERPPRVLLVVSSLAGEGKTTVAINLAVALAQQGRTCILDADLRRPSIARALHTKQTVGLGDYLADPVPLESVLTPVPDLMTLTVVAAGRTLSDPGRLINSENMRLLVRNLRRLYDFVVIDSPPLLSYADGRALAPFVDGVVFVGRAGATTREAMARSMELLREVHSAPVLEVVLNGASTESQSYAYGYRSH
jgi:polysaccharide biosynthesis transport protein